MNENGKLTSEGFDVSDNDKKILKCSFELKQDSPILLSIHSLILENNTSCTNFLLVSKSFQESNYENGFHNLLFYILV